MSTPDPIHSRTNWPTAIMWIAIVAIIAGSALFIFKSFVEAPVRVVNAIGDQPGKIARDLASSLLKGTVTTQFREYCTEVHPTLSLQVATLKQTEQFTRTDEATLGDIPLPEVVVRVTAPVQYTYCINLNGKWDFKREGDLLTVICPDPTMNQPAFDVSQMEWEVKKDSLFRRTKKIMDEFQQSLMPLAVSRGKSHIPIVLETARAQTTTFVENWVKQRFMDGGKFRVKVIFAREARQMIQSTSPAETNL